jgi:hypothetical protein
MKRFLVGLILMTAVYTTYGQQAVNNRPDWEQSVALTAAGRPASLILDNRVMGCTSFGLSFANDSFTSFSIQLDEAVAVGGVAGSWAKFGTALGTVPTGTTIPFTQVSNLNGGAFTVFKYVPFVSLNLVSTGGAGTITATFKCWRPLSQQDANAVAGNVVNQGNPPWQDNLTQVAGQTLGAIANYGTSPGAVLVPGVNAFVTNTGASATQVQGTAADGAAEVGNPVRVAGGTAGNVVQDILVDSDGTIETNTTKIGGTTYALGQALAASSAPVVLPALQLPNVGQALMASSVPVALASNQSSIPVTGSGNFNTVGTLTNNNAAPGVNNLGVLPALANAAAPTFTEGNQTLFSVDLGGALRSNVIKWGGTVLGVPANFGTTPGGVVAASVNASLFSGTTALGTPNTFGVTAPSGNALGVNAALFLGTTLATNTTPGALDATILPTSTAGSAIPPVPSTATENGHILKGSAGNLYGLTVTSTVNGLVMIFNSATVPGNGAVTPIYCLRLTPDSGGSGTFGISFLPGPPASFSTGISWAMSTGTNCASLTLSATAWGTGLVK